MQYEELVFNLIFPRKPHFQVQVDSEILLLGQLLGHVGILFGLVLHMMVWAVLGLL